MSYREPSDLIREKTQPKPEIHDARHETAARIEEKHKTAFAEEVQEKQEEEEQ